MTRLRNQGDARDPQTARVARLLRAVGPLEPDWGRMRRVRARIEARPASLAFGLDGRTGTGLALAAFAVLAIFLLVRGEHQPRMARTGDGWRRFPAGFPVAGTLEVAGGRFPLRAVGTPGSIQLVPEHGVGPGRPSLEATPTAHAVAPGDRAEGVQPAAAHAAAEPFAACEATTATPSTGAGFEAAAPAVAIVPDAERTLSTGAAAPPGGPAAGARADASGVGSADTVATDEAARSSGQRGPAPPLDPGATAPPGRGSTGARGPGAPLGTDRPLAAPGGASPRFEAVAIAFVPDGDDDDGRVIVFSGKLGEDIVLGTIRIAAALDDDDGDQYDAQFVRQRPDGNAVTSYAGRVAGGATGLDLDGDGEDDVVIGPAGPGPARAGAAGEANAWSSPPRIQVSFRAMKGGD